MDLAVENSSLSVGNLRQRALRAAHHILETQGQAGLSLRAIATDLGTGVGSLYYYFASKDALLAELAVDGFRELGDWMGLASRSPRGRSVFNACGHAYLGFTRRRPALYAIMYDERLLAAHAVVREAEARAFEVFKSSLADTGVVTAKVEDIATAFWALGRGMTSISASLGAASPGVAKTVVLRVMRGLEALAGERDRILA
ncbi:MAG TPA: TetR/AcrR family transcriptional regulator [Caulobacteraceae bacterium]|jgi:AcrR family transcriptional regulator|nr:TetR/AcrR family transcriptional regulator [Caulobacteraceae bacterium]